MKRNSILKPIAVALAGIMLSACGGGSLQSSSSSSSGSSSSASSSSSSSSASSSGSIALSYSAMCEVDAPLPEAAKLGVIRADKYQALVSAVLNLDEATHYSAAVAHYGGQVLLEADNAEQRMALAVETFYRNAEVIARQHTAVDCADLGAEQCAAGFISQFVEPLYERALSADETAYYTAFFTAEASDPSAGQYNAMIAALSSPHFWLRMEAPANDQ